MQSDKENIEFWRHKAKLPGNDSVKSLPKYVPDNKLLPKEDEKRIPLQTLQNKSDNIQQANNRKHNSPFVRDTRYVTVRNKADEDNLDWDLLVFEDNIPLIVVSDEEQSPHNTANKPSTSKDPSNEQKITPLPETSLENRTIKNIKKSLKRPHSRELQVCANSKNDNYERVLKKCRPERIFDRINPPDEVSKRDTRNLVLDYSIDMFTYLLSAERKIDNLPRVPHITRACIVNWLMKINGPNGNPSTLQTACWYLDILLSRYDVVLENLQLIATACYWLSQKIHGPVMSSMLLVKMVKGAFTVRDLLDTERCILKCLNFPNVKVIPQDFVTYFAQCTDPESPGEVEVAASFIVKAGLLVKPALACEYPSVVAAAAIKNAVLLLKKKRLMTNLLVNPIYRQAEFKAINLDGICFAQRSAIRAVAAPTCQYRACYEHYSVPPFYIARKLAVASSNLLTIFK